MIRTGLENRIETEKKKLRALQKEYDAIKGGALHIRKRRRHYYFWEYENRRQIGITRNKKRIYQLARKKYLEASIEVLEGQIGALENADKNLREISKDDKKKQVAEYCKMLDLDRVTRTPRELAWIGGRKSANTYRSENLKYATSQGVMTRSKSERFIGNVLEERGIVYVTEPEILIGGRAYYPDFMILREDGTTVIWEHCGLMDDDDYAHKALMKLKKYRSIGYVQTDNLIYTFEEDLEDMARVHEIIDRFIVR